MAIIGGGVALRGWHVTPTTVSVQDGMARRHIKACTHMPSNYDIRLIGKASSGPEGTNKNNLFGMPWLWHLQHCMR